MKWNDTNTSHEEVYAMSFSIVVTFSQIILKTFIRALDDVIIYIAMIINENYNSNNVLLHDLINNW